MRDARPRLLTAAEKERIADLYRQGATINEICRRVNRNWKAVAHVTKDLRGEKRLPCRCGRPAGHVGLCWARKRYAALGGEPKDIERLRRIFELWGDLPSELIPEDWDRAPLICHDCGTPTLKREKLARGGQIVRACPKCGWWRSEHLYIKGFYIKAPEAMSYLKWYQQGMPADMAAEMSKRHFVTTQKLWRLFHEKFGAVKCQCGADSAHGGSCWWRKLTRCEMCRRRHPSVAKTEQCCRAAKGKVAA